jgi:hypothetical protein
MVALVGRQSARHSQENQEDEMRCDARGSHSLFDNSHQGEWLGATCTRNVVGLSKSFHTRDFGKAFPDAIVQRNLTSSKSGRKQNARCPLVEFRWQTPLWLGIRPSPPVELKDGYSLRSKPPINTSVLHEHRV